MKFRFAVLVLLIMGMVIFGGCQQAQTTPDTGDTSSAPAAPGGTPGAMPDRELDALNRLAFGTLKLEGSENAVTAEQAKKLLPLWQMIQSGALKSDAESQAVVTQIENQMTEAQVAAMGELTFEDMRTWMQEQGLGMAGPAGGQAPGGQGPDGQGPDRQGPDRQGTGDLQSMTEEERAQMREKFQTMTEEERATAMAEQGFQRPEGETPPDGDGMRGGNVLLEPLITLLTGRAASN